MKLGLSIVLYKRTGNASKTKQSRPYLCTSDLPGLSLCAVPDRLVCLTGLSTRRTGDRGPGDSTDDHRAKQLGSHADGHLATCELNDCGFLSEAQAQNLIVRIETVSLREDQPHQFN